MIQSEAGYIDARPPPPIRRNLLATRGRTIHWVKNGSRGLAAGCLLCPGERTSSGCLVMSENLHNKRHWGAHSITSSTAPDEVQIEESVLTKGKEFFDPECREFNRTRIC
ncbi:hypothetical protein SAMN05443247_08327 [Bradyrhizobium erythrophlei]|nr:hypothetical protein SAMN05443247_08327 [Bradyrhizobium erythrophlei]